MAQIDVTYSDTHSINVESGKKIKDVTFSGKYEDGSNYNVNLTNNLPFTFNPKNLGLLKNSVFNLGITLGGDEMKTWLLQPATSIQTFGGSSGISPGETNTYTFSNITNIPSYFNYLTDNSKTIINNMAQESGSDIMVTVVLSSASLHGASLASSDNFVGEKCAFCVASSGSVETITVHSLTVTGENKTYYFSPDINSSANPSALYFAATNLSSTTTITAAAWYIYATYYATPMSEFPEGWSILNWCTY